jgi:hypothetical protein
MRRKGVTGSGVLFFIVSFLFGTVWAFRGRLALRWI